MAESFNHRRIVFVLIAVGCMAVPLCFASYEFWDQPLARHFEGEHPWKEWAEQVTRVGNALFSIVISIVGLVICRWWINSPVWFRRFGYIILAVAASGIPCLVLKVVCGRARPGELYDDGVYGFKFFQFKSHFQGFPSGHAATVFALAYALWRIFPRSLHFLFPGAVLLAFTRVIIGAHFLSDVIVGSLIGASSACYLESIFAKKGWSLQSDSVEGSQATTMEANQRTPSRDKPNFP